MKNIMLFCLIFSSCKSELKISEILKKSEVAYSSLESLSVESQLDFKWLSNTDTSHYYKSISWVRNPKDTLHGLDILSKDSFSIQLYRYTPDSIYSFNLRDKDSTYNEDVYIGWREERMSLSQEISAYKSIDNDTIIKTRLEDEKVNNKSCYVVQFVYPDEENEKDHWVRLYIDKNSFLPIRVERSIFLVDLNDFLRCLFSIKHIPHTFQ